RVARDGLADELPAGERGGRHLAAVDDPADGRYRRLHRRQAARRRRAGRQGQQQSGEHQPPSPMTTVKSNVTDAALAFERKSRLPDAPPLGLSWMASSLTSLTSPPSPPVCARPTLVLSVGVLPAVGAVKAVVFAAGLFLLRGSGVCAEPDVLAVAYSWARICMPPAVPKRAPPTILAMDADSCWLAVSRRRWSVAVPAEPLLVKLLARS